MLPLHAAAAAGAPPEVLRAILAHNPDAVRSLNRRA
jgi:hypothetical protein